MRLSGMRGTATSRDAGLHRDGATELDGCDRDGSEAPQPIGSDGEHRWLLRKPSLPCGLIRIEERAIRKQDNDAVLLVRAREAGP